ncbi:hypothetical protein ABZ208_05830 [Streptomyces sp. NPDC006208]|uniref:hypothetical protein n=1 Tax=Streptomyces sp. NPDC006208 TaxID=3156734 RepID=UPI0033AF1697
MVWKSSVVAEPGSGPAPMNDEELEGYADRLFRRLDNCGWAGPDPYDGMTSPLSALAVHPLLRQALLQTVKRSPVDLRPWLGIRPLRTATACGLGATACSRPGGSPLWHARAQRLGRWTADRQLSGRYAGLWRYEFDVQTRWGHYPASVPNVIATTFCADGCLDAGTLDGQAVETLAAALLEHLFNGRYFVYTPTTKVLIHNANLMGAALATRVAHLDSISRPLASRLLDAARSSVSATVAAQRPDGSWPYGTSPNLGWVDGFHTGYVLMRLDAAARGLDLDLDVAISTGAQYYFDYLFDGPLPRYYANERPRLVSPGRRDPNNDATAVRTAAWAAERGYVPLGFADDVLAAVVDGIPGCGRIPLRQPSAMMRHPARLSPRWSLTPFLDALTALRVARRNG